MFQPPMALRYQFRAVFKNLKMKKILLPILAALLIMSCDKISETDYLQKNTGVPVDTNSVLGSRRVLLEDFTGQQCGVCPEANDIAASLKTLYGEQITVMEVHVGFFSVPKTSGLKYLTDYRTDAGNDIDALFGAAAAGLPKGIVNRRDFATSEHLKDRDKWGELVVEELTKPVLAKIDRASEYNPTTRTLSLGTTTKFIQEYTNSTNLVVYLTEDSLMDWQKDYRLPSGQQDIPNYMHRHVLRASLNGSFGESLTSAPASAGDQFTKNFNYTVPSAFVAKHCALVIVLYDSVTKEVLQVEEQHIVE